MTNELHITAQRLSKDHKWIYFWLSDGRVYKRAIGKITINGDEFHFDVDHLGPLEHGVQSMTPDDDRFLQFKDEA